MLTEMFHYSLHQPLTLSTSTITGRIMSPYAMIKYTIFPKYLYFFLLCDPIACHQTFYCIDLYGLSVDQQIYCKVSCVSLDMFNVHPIQLTEGDS